MIRSVKFTTETAKKKKNPKKGGKKPTVLIKFQISQYSKKTSTASLGRLGDHHLENAVVHHNLHLGELQVLRGPDAEAEVADVHGVALLVRLLLPEAMDHHVVPLKVDVNILLRHSGHQDPNEYVVLGFCRRGSTNQFSFNIHSFEPKSTSCYIYIHTNINT